MQKTYEPMYRLSLDNDVEETIGFFNNCEGLDPAASTLRLFNGFLTENFSEDKILKDTYFSLDIHDIRGQQIAGFSTGVVVDLTIRATQNPNEVVLFSEEGVGLPSMLPGSLALWKERRFGMPNELGQWLTLDRSGREAWLEVAIMDTRKYANLRNLKEIELDGTIITDDLSFYCAFGEAFGGPGSYMGRCLGALEDCLNSSEFPRAPQTIIWKNSQFSKLSFQDNGQEKIYYIMLSILKDANIDVVFV